MRSTSELITAAQATMLKWPAIWLPPFMISALQLMSSGPYMNAAAQGIVVVTTNLGVFLIEAGWVALIARALNNQPVRMEDFRAGVNKHWVSLVCGNLAFYILLAALLGVMAAAGNALYGMDSLEQWFKSIEGLSPEKLEAILKPDGLPAPIKGWLGLFAGWMALTVVASFLLLFWQPVVVLRGVGWWRGWLGSVRLVFTRFGQALVVALMNAALLFASLGVVTAGSAVMALLGLGMLLLVMTYFKILYATFVADTWPPPVDAHA